MRQQLRPMVKSYTKKIADAKTIAIITHTNPDADAVGSSLALKRLIKHNCELVGLDVSVDVFMENETFDEKCKPLLCDENVNVQNFDKYDLAITLDCASIERLGKYAEIFNNASTTINFDHHDTNTKFADTNFIAKKFSSTAELIYLLYIKGENWEWSADVLCLLYAGMITDSNNLTHNVGINTLSTIVDIMSKANSIGLNLDAIRDYYFKNNSPEQLALLTRALNSIAFFNNGRVAIMKINKQDFIDTETTQSDTVGIVDYANQLQGVKIGVLFIKQEDGTYYVSLRSKGNVNVGQIAKEMGGGGHQNVAAFKTEPGQTYTEIRSKLIAFCKKEFELNGNDIDINSLFFDISERAKDMTIENKGPNS